MRIVKMFWRGRGMKHEIDAKKLAHQSMRRKLLGLMGLAILVGCDDMFGKVQKKSMIDPEHGKEFERNGEKYRVFIVGGVRFVVPASPQAEQADSDAKAGFHLNLVWPNIPPGKAPDTQVKAEQIDAFGNMPINSVIVQVHENEFAETGDTYTKYVKRGWYESRPDLIAHDDLRLGLRIFIHKDVSQQKIDYGFYNEAYSILDDVSTPHFREPVVINAGLISFAYSPKISVRIIMNGWGTKINPDWKGIYLGVVQTLNNYQEEGKK